MAIKNYNPITPSQRGLIAIDKAELWKGSPAIRIEIPFRNISMLIILFTFEAFYFIL